MSDGGDGAGGPSAVGRVLPQWSIEGPIFQAMEDALEKLKILDYESHFCQPKRRPAFDRTYFAVPAKNPSVQLQNFLDIVSWLTLEISGEENLFKVDKFDDPNTSANKLVLALRNLNINLDFPVAKLKQPYGEAVCTVIDLLCERALQKKNFAWQRPIYREEIEAEEAEVDEEADVGDGVLDEAVEEEEEEAIFSEVARGPKDSDSTEKSEIDRKVLASNVDPIRWKTELERVSSRLLPPQSFYGAKEWREHIDQTKKNEETIQAVFQETKGQLQAISEDVGSALERIGNKEKYINNQFDHLKQEFGTLKRELKEMEGNYQAVNCRVATLSNDLGVITDRLEEIKDSMNDRGQSMTDTSPLVKIRAALQAVKAEIQTYDLRIGVVEHTLLHARIRSERQHAKKRKGHRQKSEDDLSDLDVHR